MLQPLYSHSVETAPLRRVCLRPKREIVCPIRWLVRNTVLECHLEHFLSSSMVSSYLVHHGYCATATAFARMTETPIQEEQASIKNRQSKVDTPLPSHPVTHLSLTLLSGLYQLGYCQESLQLWSSTLGDQPAQSPSPAPAPCPALFSFRTTLPTWVVWQHENVSLQPP